MGVGSAHALRNTIYVKEQFISALGMDGGTGCQAGRCALRFLLHYRTHPTWPVTAPVRPAVAAVVAA